jgi:hypothetical protein
MSGTADGSFASRLGRGFLLLTAGLGCGGVCAFAPDISAAVLVLQLPGVIAWLLDSTPGKAIGRTVLLFQGAASIEPIASMWFQCEGMRTCVAMATDRRTYLSVLLASLGGFVLTQGMPLILKVADDARMMIRRGRLVSQRQAIVEEWELER